MKICKLNDNQKPSFCWDRDWTVREIKTRLQSSKDNDRIRLISWILREATFKEVWSFFTPEEIYPLFPELVPWLGKKKEYWRYTFDVWHKLGKV